MSTIPKNNHNGIRATYSGVTEQEYATKASTPDLQFSIRSAVVRVYTCPPSAKPELFHPTQELRGGACVPTPTTSARRKRPRPKRELHALSHSFECFVKARATNHFVKATASPHSTRHGMIAPYRGSATRGCYARTARQPTTGGKNPCAGNTQRAIIYQSVPKI